MLIRRTTHSPSRESMRRGLDCQWCVPFMGERAGVRWNHRRQDSRLLRSSYTLCSAATGFTLITQILIARPENERERLRVKNRQCFFSLGRRIPYEKEKSTSSKGISQKCVVLKTSTVVEVLLLTRFWNRKETFCPPWGQRPGFCDRVSFTDATDS